MIWWARILWPPTRIKYIVLQKPVARMISASSSSLIDPRYRDRRRIAIEEGADIYAIARDDHRAIRDRAYVNGPASNKVLAIGIEFGRST
jgi:hypothetical protein